MQSDITPRPRTDFSSGPAVHRGDYGLTPEAASANQPTPTSIQIPIVDNSTPIEITPAPSSIPSAEPLLVTPASAPVLEPIQGSAPILETPIAAPVPAPIVPDPTIASAVANLEVEPILVATPAPILSPVQLDASTDAPADSDSDFAGLDMGQNSPQFVAPASVPVAEPTVASGAVPAIAPVLPPITEQSSDNRNLDSLLQSVNGIPAQAPITEAKKPSAMSRWLSEHRKPLRAGTAAAVLLLVSFSGFGIYHGYTKDTPYVSIAAPKPVAPTAAKATAKLASANFADNSDDDKRQKAIKSLHEAVEAYYVQKGYYPTNNNMQNLAWIAANFKNFDMTQLKDPAGTMAGIVAASGKGLYAYQASIDPSMRSCDNDFSNCNYYVLTATLSDGSAYTSIALQ